MKKLIVVLFLVFFLSIVSIGITKGGKDKLAVLTPNMEFVEETFIDYGVPSHAGPGPHPTTESKDFHLIQGGIRWFLNATALEYSITGTEDVSGGNTAIENAVATWGGFITTRDFTRDDVNPSTNLCGGDNEIRWGSIDGPGGILATASVCRNVATKEIVGFRVTMDTGDNWAIGNVTGKFDVENVASHEFGHVAGLGHDNPPKSGCLTMYKFASTGETQKRTLGLGYKLGMDKLYSTDNTSPGPGCEL